MATTYRADHYYRYDEMTEWLREIATAHPEICTMESLGETPESRQIWLMTLGGKNHQDKPGIWVDGNIHATEFAGSSACLHAIELLLTRHKDLLQERSFYIVPRVNPDGAEFCLTTGIGTRSVRRVWPREDQEGGFQEKDIDGNGEILQMRVPHPDGAWAQSAEDDRLMIPRRPWHQGPFYDIYPEGIFDEDALGDPRWPVGKDIYALDFNRNFPYRWRPEHEQYGAGPYPLSEPETRTIGEFLVRQKNICAALTCHTFSGVLLRPASDTADKDLPKFDLASFKVIGDRCEELTGYPCLSTYQEFRYDESSTISGTFEDWAYENLGLHAYTLEVWSPFQAAGLDMGRDPLRFFKTRTVEDERTMLAWSDDALGGQGFMRWTKAEHPQLGEVEIGGWRWLYTVRNPPPQYLEEESQKSFEIIKILSDMLPSVSMQVTTEKLSENVHRLIVDISNNGFLPTNVTDRARAKSIIGKPWLTIQSQNVEILEPTRIELEHLDGYGNRSWAMMRGFRFPIRDRSQNIRKVWTIKGKGQVEVSLHGDRIGSRKEIINVS